MPISKIEICNLALSMLGADAIRSFDERNKRARMADVFFDFTRDYLLTKFDWPFARKFAKLQPLDMTDMYAPSGSFAYQLPNDCHRPRELYPPGSREPWRIMGSTLYCAVPPDAGIDVALYYTAAVTDAKMYTSTFSHLLSLGLAVKMAPSITQDKGLTKALADQFALDQLSAWESEANVGEEYRVPDETPDNDTFVSPDGFVTPDPWL